MLQSIQIGNFKAFADLQQIPLCPLTLIYGANSSGKSSIIHSLLLAKHVEETGNWDAHRTAIGGESVDLGGFRQYVHCHDVTHYVEWIFEFNPSTFRSQRQLSFWKSHNSLKLQISVGINLEDPALVSSEPSPYIHHYSIIADNREILKMVVRNDRTLQLAFLDLDNSAFQDLLSKGNLYTLTRKRLKPDDLSKAKDALYSLLDEVAVECQHLLPTRFISTKSETLDDSGSDSIALSPWEQRKKESSSKKHALRFLRSLEGILLQVNRAVAWQLNKLIYLGPLRSYPPRQLLSAQHYDSNWQAGGGYAWDVVRNNAEVREKVNTWLSAANRLQTPYKLVLRSLVDINQLEDPVYEWLEKLMPENNSDGNSTDDRSTQHFLLVDLEKEAASFCDFIRSSSIEKHSDLLLMDCRSNTTVSHRDIGIGVSQVLPVLVSAYASYEQIIAIEQPEIHLHPALQADLADIFIESSLGPQQNRFILETHSEHLLLRIMRRMRETVDNELPEGAAPVTPKDICILFVEPQGSASVIRHLRLDDEGELLDTWPGGFFEEGFRERFG